MAVRFATMVGYDTIIVPSVIYSTVIVQSTGWTIMHSLYTALGAHYSSAWLSTVCNYIIVYTSSYKVVLPRFDSRRLAVRAELKNSWAELFWWLTAQGPLHTESSWLWVALSRLSHDLFHTWQDNHCSSHFNGSNTPGNVYDRSQAFHYQVWPKRCAIYLWYILTTLWLST